MRCELIVHTVPGEPQRVQRRHNQPERSTGDGLDLHGAVERNLGRAGLESAEPGIDIALRSRPPGALDAGEEPEGSNIVGELARRLDYAIPGVCLAGALQGQEFRRAGRRAVGAHASYPPTDCAVPLAPALFDLPD